ncbi:MAG: 3-isopropylmalate dehydrogenase [Myxococcota bacterium]|jgi:3-isopropylmalate dehydrogenase
MAKIAVVPGDGIGTEVIEQGVRVLSEIAPDLTFEWFDLGADRYLRDGVTLPDDVFNRWKAEFDCIYLGALGDPRVPSNVHAKDILLGSRFRLDLFINLRPIKLLDARRCPLKGKTCDDVDIVVFRENTEDLYTGMGGTFKQGTPDEVAQEVCIATRKGVERIVRAAFAYTKSRGLSKVCMSDKSNAMRYTGGLWQRVFAEVAAEYPSIEASHLYVDVLAMELVRCPERFEVVVTSNLFGDIVTDLGAILQGGIGLAGSGNIHPGRLSLFEPVHGSAPDIAGQGIANPLAAILTAGMMLNHLGRPEDEKRIQDAVQACLLNDEVTRELGGNLSTVQVTDAFLSRLT